MEVVALVEIVDEAGVFFSARQRPAASLAAEVGIAVLRIAFERWIVEGSVPYCGRVGVDADISVPARLIAEPARARMLVGLVGGICLPAGDLARLAGVSASTASGHLKALVAHGFVTVERSGRHRYYTLANADIAYALEALQVVAPEIPVTSLRGHRVAAELRAGRRCYDHMAGDLGLQVTGLLVRAGIVGPLRAGATADLHLDGPGHPLLDRFALQEIGGSPRRPLVRGCLDWTGRQPHVAGRLGAHLLTVFLDRGWVTTRPGSRALRLTGAGESVLVSLDAGVSAAWEAG
ncbi:MULTISPECIES: helix-turn-helix transcriptional regulator [unclassified Frankia]|uniref:ArsR/SmtB family transcription factor n=1 Tax=unclassified Frankia TaxID=2632575 RepID=UPI002AD539EC|nr:MULTISPECIES: helix-turn-helix transcriptional regulator [unclassified Frankia]